MDPMTMLLKLNELIQVLCLLSETAVFYKRNCETLVGCIKLLNPFIDELKDGDAPLAFLEPPTLEKIETLFLITKELLKRCAGHGSKSLVVLQKHQVVKEFKEVSLELHRYIESLPLESLNITEGTYKQVQQCLEFLKRAGYCVDAFEEQLLEEVGSVIKASRRGQKVSHEMLVKLAATLGLESNQEILMEASYLEKEKRSGLLNKAKQEEEMINVLVGLFAQMADELAEEKQAQVVKDGICIPADFLCPLSLELMSDPVIVASGQTYEKVYIQQWLDRGLTTCPKTRQVLSHITLIPNYTVKGLITNWCEMNNVPIPERAKLETPMLQGTLLTRSNASNQENLQPPVSGPRFHSDNPVVGNRPGAQSVRTRGRGREEPRRELRESIEDRRDYLGLSDAPCLPAMLLREQDHRHSRNTSTSSAGSSFEDTTTMASAEDSAQLPLSKNGSSPYASDMSGEIDRLSISSTSASGHHDDDGYSRSVGDHVSTSMDNVPSNGRRENARITPLLSSTNERNDLQSKVEAWVDDLHAAVEETQRNAVVELRLLAKHNMENRIIIANCGAIVPLVSLLPSTDPHIQENAVTALLNLSINDNNKTEIAAAGAVSPLVHVLNVGTTEARENAAATLFSLSVMDENKKTIGQSGAIAPLVDLLIHGTPRGKKDAATALFNLSIYHENKARIVSAKAVRPLINLMSDPASGMVDKAVAVLANLATIPEGRSSIGEEGIPALVEVVELGSQRGKEHAAATLLHLCLNSNRFKAKVLQEGAIPPLVALSKSGTARAKEKASALLRLFREQRHAAHGRGVDTHANHHF